MAVGGVISFILGVVLWQQWPNPVLWFIGTCVGIDLVWHGTAWVMFGLGLRQLPHATSS